jgi:hypothetical protein
MIRSFALALFCFMLGGSSASAQRVILEGRGEIETDTILERVGNTRFLVLTMDTVIPATDTLRGPVLIAATTIKLENVIVGDVVIIDANVFMRPHSRITGDVVNIAGGLFRAETAIVDGVLREYKQAPYRAEIRDDGIHVVGTEIESNLDLDGFGGFHAPTYDRVSGLSVAWGARYLLPRIGLSEPWIGASLGYQTSREKFYGSVHAGVERGNVQFRAVLERLMFTNDAWLRGWSNSISYLAGGHDLRDYYEADRLYFGPRITGTLAGGGLDLSLNAQIEEAYSVASQDAWHAWGDSVRPNPFIDDGRTSSLVLRSRLEWERARFVAEINLNLEAAGHAIGGDHEFARFDFGGLWAMQAIADHTFVIRWRARGPLATDSLPRQRWNSLGGRATLWTLDDASLRGDRLAFIHSSYVLPLPRFLTMPILGRPAIEAVHRIGNAWTFAENGDLVQNVGLGFRFRIAYITAVIDPENDDDTLILVGLSIPRRFPWNLD